MRFIVSVKEVVSHLSGAGSIVIKPNTSKENARMGQKVDKASAKPEGLRKIYQ
jgi:hypothetical protein